MHKTIFILLLLASLAGCNVSEENKSKAEAMSLQMPDQVSDSVRIVYSEQGIIKATVEAPTLIMRDTPKEKFNEFPDGISMLMFDKEGNQAADLFGLYGYDNPRTNERIIRDSVVIITDKGDTIKTDELIMLQQKDSIHNNGKYFTITQKDGTFLQGYGIVANNSFQNIRLNNVFQSQYAIEEDALSSPNQNTQTPTSSPTSTTKKKLRPNIEEEILVKDPS